MTLPSMMFVGTALAILVGVAEARELKSVGVSVGTLGNPFFTTIERGAEAAVCKINPSAKVTVVSTDYDLGKQTNQINSFIAAGVDLIVLDAVDPKAITPAIERAKSASLPCAHAPRATVTSCLLVLADQLVLDRVQRRVEPSMRFAKNASPSCRGLTSSSSCGLAGPLKPPSASADVILSNPSSRRVAAIGLSLDDPECPTADRRTSVEVSPWALDRSAVIRHRRWPN